MHVFNTVSSVEVHVAAVTFEFEPECVCTG